jgi:hypothetical protein
VRQLVAARLEDGQLNDSGLTLGEIRRVETSMVTSILASRHNRVKYPATAKADDAKEAKEEPRDNFRPLSSDVAPTDAYEFVRQAGVVPTSRKVELDKKQASVSAKKKSRSDGKKDVKNDFKSKDKETSAKNGSGGRAYPKTARKKRK